MLIRIHHTLQFHYDRPVFLEPMTVRLSPRQDATQQRLLHSLKVCSAPAGTAWIIEPDGNEAAVLWFSEERENLQLTAESEVSTLRVNPFDWILTDPRAQRLPLDYEPALAASLAPARLDEATPAVRAWAEGLALAVDRSTTAFLTHLVDSIHTTFHHIGRLDGDPQTPDQTLETRTGACRDTAMLFVAASRTQGLAARFVSGYSIHHPPEVTEQELHAWAEVYLPGGGWRGYDPSLGLAVADGHIGLAAAPDHRLAAPVVGTYRGTGVGSTMRYMINLAPIEATS
ncbi:MULTISPECIES: transglutaminase family protein [unclassified Synechococcus]|uniref:transglutaminase family protein n=1 Tax=unclassified Synechococcus TaxID=2626047 RepID=UPI0021A6BFD9|nr:MULTISPECIES: transglutaminase family protein [unclassified Synechococcus]MCT0213970.1 transglutaminase family protein [Synechococcus sp. CS-1326]MCT0233546.1 transglutaminase family protein [Synechococcus sp. CS-1327]